MTTDQDETGGGFDRAARDFDRLGRFLWRPIGRATVARTGPVAGERVLDACCGNGASALPAAERVGTRGAVDAVDVSTGLLEQLRQGARDVPQLTAHHGDVTAWEPGGYDVVQCVLGIFFFPDMAAGTRHLISRARPGGRVGLTIWRRGAVEDAGRHLRRAVAEVTGQGIDEERPEHLIDRVNEAGAFAAWLRDFGLEQVQVTESPLSVPMNPEVAWLVITGSGFTAALRGLDDAQTEHVRDLYLHSLSEASIRQLDATTLIATGIRR